MRSNNDKKWLQEYNDALLTSIGPTHMVTINFRQPLPGGRETRQKNLFIHLREWNREVLKALFGRQFAIRNAHDDFLFIGIMEIGPFLQKEHVHLLVRVPEHLIPKFELHAALLWKPRKIAMALGQQRTCLEPDIVIQRCADYVRGPIGAIEYCTKRLTRNMDGVVWSCEFRNSGSNK